jgi:kinetochore protein Mis13/DSN1
LCFKDVGLIDCLAYDEEDDGFAFTRTRAKKAKAEPKLPSTIEEDRREVQAEPVQPRKSRKKSVGSPSAEPAQSESRVGKRRSARRSGEHESAENADPPVLQVKKRRKDRNSGEMQPDQEGRNSHKDGSRTEQGPQQDHTHPVEYTFDVTKIALPFADTPIIRRNKEMRKTNGRRRSSLGNRGRRASSLIDTGKSNGMSFLCVEPEFSLNMKQLYHTTKLKALNSTNT